MPFKLRSVVQSPSFTRFHDSERFPLSFALTATAQWRHTLRDTNVAEPYTGKKLLNDLLKLKTTQDHNLKTRILSLDHEITALDQVIAAKEREMNNLVAGLCGVDSHQF